MGFTMMLMALIAVWRALLFPHQQVGGDPAHAVRPRLPRRGRRQREDLRHRGRQDQRGQLLQGEVRTTW